MKKNNKLTLLYDISILGEGHFDTRKRTGIFRVVESLFNQYNKNNDINLKFCASQFNYKDCINYLKENNPDLVQNFLCNTRGGKIKFVFFLRKVIESLANFWDKFHPSSNIFRKIRNHFQILTKILFLTPDVIDKNDCTKIDVYHSAWFDIPCQISKNKKIKIFITIYDLIPIYMEKMYSFSFLTKFFYSIKIKRIKKNYNVICISNYTKSDFVKYYPDYPENKIKVIYCGIDEGKFYPVKNESQINAVKKKYNIPTHKNAKYFLTISSLSPRKNMVHIIQCFVEFIKKYNISDLYLVLSGPLGWMYSSIFEEIKGLKNIQDRIITTGFVDDKDMSSLYSGAYLYTFMSLCEGFGLTPVEAMMCGVPVVVSNTPSIPEAVGENAILLNPKDKNKLIEAFYRLFNDEKLYNDLAIKGLSHAKKFSWEKCANEYLQLFKEVMSDS